LVSDGSLRIDVPDGKGGVSAKDVPMRSGMNEVTRAAYIRDCDVGLQRWNRLVAKAGRDFRFRPPSARFHRSIGIWGQCGDRPRGTPDRRP
jgi:benzoyl-CoA 2,3-dioxygenase component B